MLNDAKSHSEYFEELCALAASGQISEPQFVELSDHMQICVLCQSAYGDFVDLVHNKLPLADPELTGSFKLGRPSSKESSYRERFVTRARKEGLAVSREALSGVPESRSGSSWFLRLNFAQVAPLAMALLVLTAGLLGYAWRQTNARYTTLAAKFAALSGQIRPRERPELSPAKIPLPESQHESRTLPLTTVPGPAVVPPTNSYDADLVRVRQDYETAAASAKDAEDRFQKVTAELQIVKAQLTGSNDAVTQLQNSLKSAEMASERAIGDFRTVSENLKRSASTLEDQSRQIQELRIKLSASTAPSERGNVLFANGLEIRDQLLDLRFADVHDVDSRGKESRASARIFYTDGKSKSLLFVASGLSGRAGAKGAVFQVWGARGLSGTSPRSLGIFDIDNPRTDLWALTVNDPSKLEGIDTVFVTLEKAGGSEKPSAKQIMYAYLPQIPTKQ